MQYAAIRVSKHSVLSPSNKLSDFAGDTHGQYNFADDTHGQYNFADDTHGTQYHFADNTHAQYQDSGSCIHIEIKTWESYVFSPHC